jgi:hypothetical protein
LRPVIEHEIELPEAVWQAVRDCQIHCDAACTKKEETDGFKAYQDRSLCPQPVEAFRRSALPRDWSLVQFPTAACRIVDAGLIFSVQLARRCG